MSNAQQRNDRPPGEDEAIPTLSFTGGAVAPGGLVGPYKLLSILGEGGFAVVYLAEQREPVKRRVALKIIKPGMDTKQVIARFEAERQALALLDHPNVAHVYDAGTTDLGRPYFVMEYVKGVPITEHCDRHKLTIEGRLRLFLQVCEAVQHAHQKGIIHRDIKPSNILILFEGQRALPKVIDFGIAKAISQPLTERTLYTEQGQLVGTPEYMSPEQAEMTSQDIDTRSDIYSLGVLLYELMTGVLPFEAEELRKGGLDHIRTVIREQEPRTPSTRLSRLTHEESTKLAQHRRAEPRALRRRLRGDLDWITLKAMEKDRTRRYGSAGELAADIQHHLNHEPVVAGPPSTIYRAKKFVRRHKSLVTGVAAVLAVLIAGVVVSTIFAIKAERARAEAQLITDFLENDVLSSVGKVKGREATVDDILNAASKSLEGRFHDQPLVEADICWSLGMTYRQLGDHRASIPHLARLYQIRREHLGEQQGPTRVAKNYLALAYKNSGEYEEAERLFDELIEARQRSNPENVGLLLPWYKCNLATVYICQGRYEEAEPLLLETLASETAWWEGSSPEGKPYLQHLAEIYLYKGRYEEAEQLFKETVEKKGREKSSDPEAAVHSMDGLGRLYMTQGRYEEAEEQFIKGIDAGRRWLPGKEHPTTLRIINDLGVLRTKQKKYEDAEHLFHEVLKARKDKLGDDHPSTLESKNDLAVLYKEQGFYDEAEKLLLEAVEGRKLKLGQQHPHTLESIKNLVELYQAWGKLEQAEQWRAKLPCKKATEDNRKGTTHDRQ